MHVRKTTGAVTLKRQRQAAPALALRDKLLGHFPPDLAALLLEFNKHVAALDADYIIFMARKSLRLYDLLLMAGGPTSEKVVLSDHVLDQSLSMFQGKRVCLIDDTLILGTTLGEAKRKLVAAGAGEVTCHVFAVDIDSWSRQLVVPERVMVQLQHQQMLTFCAREVAALAAAGIPYLSDFPFSESIRLTGPKLSLLHAISGWDTHTLTTPVHERAGVSLYTFLPARETYDVLHSALGPTIFRLLELTKIRAFCRHAGGAYWVRFIPIVTLKPLAESDVERLFLYVLDRLETGRAGITEKIKAAVVGTVGKLRFVQYVSSVATGSLFLEQFTNVAAVRARATFDLNEAVRLFGPWLRTELERLHTLIPVVFGVANEDGKSRGLMIHEATLPETVVNVSKTEYVEFLHGTPTGTSKGSQSARSHFTDLVRAFIGLHRKYELPAREEARRLGESVFDVPASEAPFRDRLKFGFAWRALVDCLLADEKLKVTPRRRNWLSLLLDHLIDLGIAVPVLCLRDGVLFRAYRYGEDVPFGDQELALAYDTVSGYVDGAKRQTIPRIVLEKLLVSLLRVGVAKEFLTVLHGLSGTEGIARIGFHLHGAVPMLPSHDTFFADDQDSWLSQYLVDRGVLAVDETGMYRLGVKPEASYASARAPGEARQLGWLIGFLSTAQSETGRARLSESDLIVLASCIQPRDTACAVAAELKLITRWIDRGLARTTKDVQWSVEADLNDRLKSLVNGLGYIAMHSARLKLDAHREGRPGQIVSECAAYLETVPQGSLLSSLWNSDWQAVLAAASEEQRNRFDPWTALVAKEVLVAALGIFSIELALSSAHIRLNPTRSVVREFDLACSKVAAYLDALDQGCQLARRERDLLEHLRNTVNGKVPMDAPTSALSFGLKWLNTRASAMRALVTQIEEVARDFGRTDKRLNFQYTLWYDIIDSTGQKSGLAGDALKEYRSRVRGLKNDLQKQIYGVVRDSARSNASVYPWQGPLDSKDDEKHLFFYGARSLGWLQQTMKLLLAAADSRRVKVRAVAIPANFSGIAAHKYAASSNVEGEAFWEHFSRIKPELRKIESSLAANKPGHPARRSYLWIAGDLRRTLDLAGIARWTAQPEEYELVTEIDGLQLTTIVTGGAATSFAG